MCVFHHYSHVFVPCRAIRSSLFSYPLPFSRPFLLQCSLPFLFFYVFLAHWSIFGVVSTGILMCVFHHSHVLVLRRVTWSPLFSYPLIFSRLFFTMFLPFPFVLCLFGSLIYICCSFHGHSMCVFHHYSHVFVPCRVIWSSLFSCPLPFSRSFLSESSFPFPFFHPFLSLDLYLL